jgi:glutamine cyclotransferase
MALLDEQAIPSQLFAEGLTRLSDRTLLLTWRARRMLILDNDSLSIRGAMQIPTEGWGITHSDNIVWYSDGSDRLFSFDASSTTPTLASINVTLNGKPVRQLNELEWINGEIWANVWQRDEILRIDPSSGDVLAVIDLKQLFPKALRPRGTDVLNGIAHDPDTGKIWVTGKYWPWMYAIAPAPKEAQSR